MPNTYFPVHTARIFYSTISDKYQGLNPWWVTGYTDAKGCFMMNTAKAKTAKLGYTVRFIYQISIHTSDIVIFQRLKENFNNKGEAFEAAGYVHFKVTNFKDLQEVIIPHFSAYPFQ